MIDRNAVIENGGIADTCHGHTTRRIEKPKPNDSQQKIKKDRQKNTQALLSLLPMLGNCIQKFFKVIISLTKKLKRNAPLGLNSDP